MNRLSRPVRVASIQTSVFYGGDENRLLTYLHSFDRRRFDHTAMVILESSTSGEEAGGPMLDKYQAAGVDLVCLGETSFKERRPLPRPLAMARKGWTFARVVRRLAAELRRRQIEVVDARLSLGTAIASAAARLAGGIPVVATNYGYDYWNSKLGWLPGQITLAQLDTLVSDSRAKLNAMGEWSVMPPRLAHVPNGLEPPRPRLDRAEMRRRLGLPQEATVVGQVARVLDFKGQDRVVEAAPRVLAEVPDAWFVLCGYPQRGAQFWQTLTDRIAALGLTERVKLLSWPGPIADIWTALDLHVHPTRHDSSPIAILEAMAHGLPSVCTDIGGIAEVVQHGQTGLVLEDGGPEPLSAALIDLLKDPERRTRMGAAAHRRYQDQHSARHMAAQMESLFEAAARRRRRAQKGGAL